MTDSKFIPKPKILFCGPAEFLRPILKILGKDVPTFPSQSVAVSCHPLCFPLLSSGFFPSTSWK